MLWTISQLSHAYGAHQALRGLDFATAQPLQSLALVGPSGGGKSTLLRLMAGLELPTSGLLQLDGTALPRTDAGLLAHRRAHGFLFQAYNLFPHLSVVENIALPLRAVHGMAPAAARERAMELLERFQLASHAGKAPRQLSGGQQQRAALARAMAPRPQILFLDEPTAALDPEMTAEVLDMALELIRGGQRLVLATHELGFARAAAGHCAFVKDGRILEHGPPSQVLGTPQAPEVARFLETTGKFQ